MPQATTHDPEAKLKELGLTLPPPTKPVASYVHTVRTGNLLFVAGQIPSRDGKPVFTGKVGKNVTFENAVEGARIATLNGLAAVKAAVGDLRAVKRVVKVVGFVACTETFTDIPKVINGASDLLVAVFGENGRHARSAVGTNVLPLDVPVEVEFVFEV